MKFMMLAVLMLLAASVFGQDPSESQLNEGMASARLIAAERMQPVTSKQCVADMAGWEARNESDTKANVQAPDYWYEKFSTEELMRLSRESVACSGHMANGLQRAKFLSYDGQFLSELYGRAEAILRNHGLIHELLLETSR
jgi:uncharacterized protein YcfL